LQMNGSRVDASVCQFPVHLDCFCKPTSYIFFNGTVVGSGTNESIKVKL